MKKRFLKWRYKRAYRKVENSNTHLSCGDSLCSYISCDYYRLKVKFNRIADKLSKVDSNCPKFRYKLT